MVKLKHNPTPKLPDLEQVKDPAVKNVSEETARIIYDSYKNIYDDLVKLSVGRSSSLPTAGIDYLAKFYLVSQVSAKDKLYICLYNSSDTTYYWKEILQTEDNSDLWEIDGTETQLKTADEIDMRSKKIINLLDPTADQDAATKKYVDDNETALDYKVQADAGDASPGYLDAKVDGTTIEVTAGDVLGVKDGGVSEGKLGSSAVSQGKLKTTTGEVSTTSGTGANLTLPGGEYGFYPQIKDSGSGFDEAKICKSSGIIGTYTSNIFLDPTGGTVYAQQRYVTASGKDHWVFLLVDKITGDILAGYSAPDHPMYGNGGDINDVPHPFLGNDMTDKEVVILGKAEVAQLKARATRKDSILTIIHKEYKVDTKKELQYQPLHTGAFIDKEAILLNSLPDGIKVRALQAK